MRPAALGLLGGVILNHAALAATVSGPNALALAALVGEHAPTMSYQQKRVLARLFGGKLAGAADASAKTSVQADSVVCRSSNIDIIARSCKLTFGTSQVALIGRRANELDATIAGAGVGPEGAAGSIFTGLAHLSCTIDPSVIRQRAGGGADCRFEPDN